MLLTSHQKEDLGSIGNSSGITIRLSSSKLIRGRTLKRKIFSVHPKDMQACAFCSLFSASSPDLLAAQKESHEASPLNLGPWLTLHGIHRLPWISLQNSIANFISLSGLTAQHVEVSTS